MFGEVTAPLPLYLPQIINRLATNWVEAFAATSRQLTAWLRHDPLLGASGCSCKQRRIVSSLSHTLPSPHVLARLPLVGVLFSFVTETFGKICVGNSNSVETGQIHRTIFMKIWALSYCWEWSTVNRERTRSKHICVSVAKLLILITLLTATIHRQCFFFCLSRDHKVRTTRRKVALCLHGLSCFYSLVGLVGKPEGKRPLGRPRHRREDNIKMDLQDVGRGCGDWMELA